MTNSARTGMVLLVLVQGVAGCGGSGDSSIPSAPLAPLAPLAPTPAPPLSVDAISPNLGSTGGATPVQIYGSGLQSGSVILGGVRVPARFDHRDPAGTVIYLDTPPHAAGTVDLVVTNPAGRADTLAGGYTYASPQSFDFNGTWAGFGNAGQDIPIFFTIKNNALVSISCDVYVTLTFSTPPPVINGEFSYSRDDGVAVSGRIVSAFAAVGTLNLAPCTATEWGASRW